jgi:hypothetical protein
VTITALKAQAAGRTDGILRHDAGGLQYRQPEQRRHQAGAENQTTMRGGARHTISSADQFYALDIRPCSVVRFGVEGHKHKRLATGVLEGVRGARRKHEAPRFTGRHRDFFYPLAARVTHQRGSEHGRDLGAAQMPVIAANRSGLGDYRMHVAPPVQQGRFERLEYAAAAIGMDLELLDLDLSRAHRSGHCIPGAAQCP